MKIRQTIEKEITWAQLKTMATTGGAAQLIHPFDEIPVILEGGEAITVDAGRSNTVSLPVSGLESAAENDNSLAARRGAPVPGGPCFRGGAGRAQRHHRCGAGGH